MSLLDKIGRSRVDVCKSAMRKSDKVVIDLGMLSSDLYKQSDYQIVWVSMPVGEYIMGYTKYREYFSELYDFLEYMPSVEEYTPIYVIRYFRTSFVHPNPSYRNEEYRAVVGVKFEVWSRYSALKALWSIFKECEKLYEKKFCVTLDCRMDVYWKKPKDYTLYKDYEYSYTITEDLIEEFGRFYFYNYGISNLIFDLVCHISRCPRRMIDTGIVRDMVGRFLKRVGYEFAGQD